MLIQKIVFRIKEKKIYILNQKIYTFDLIYKFDL